MNITKAEQVEQAYELSLQDNLCSNIRCYARAIEKATALGGIEIDNSNDDRDITKSCAPKVTFEFDDLSRAQVKCGGVFIFF